VVLGGAARANGPNSLHYGGDTRKMTREACAQKAVEAMGVKERFCFAEVTPDGNARGWSDKTAVLVLSAPTPVKENVFFLVIVAGKDNAEAERLRNVIRTHILDGPHDPGVPTRFGPEEGTAPPPPLALCLQGETRTIISPLRFFEAVASIVLEKRGFGTKAEGKMLVVGGNPQQMAALAILTPTASGLSVRLNVVAITADKASAEDLAKELLQGMVKVFYE
jgi:hypothetical protein